MNNKSDYHSIIKQMDPSPEQQEPILSRGQDIVVTAGAGTGKTRTLVARYLSLLAEGMPVRSIIAITFTKKAAREMRNRIREEVRIYLERSDLDQSDLQFWRDIYEGLDAARISTIHSLGADILRQHPAEMKLDPKFELLDEGETARLKTQAVAAALGWAAQDPKASIIFPIFGDWKLQRVIGELLSKRLDILDLLNNKPEDLWEIWQPILVQPIREFIEHPLVSSGLDGLVSLEDQGLIQQAESAGDLLVDDLRIVIKQWQKIQKAINKKDWIEISRCLGPLRNHLKQKGKKDNWAPANPRAVIKEIQPLYDEYLGSANLDLNVDRKLAQEIIPGLLATFQYANQWYDSAKERLHGLDFDDLENYSMLLFQNFPKVKEYWQGQIRALLVDEYQDTNDRQRELVNQLNGNNNHLFIVGDGKQSIYRFRGADVAVFRQEQFEIDNRGKSFQLSTSYRAHPSLLQNLNAILEPVLGVETDVPYIEPFSGLNPGREKNPRKKNPPYIELHLAAGTKADGAGRVAAQALAARLKDLVLGQLQNGEQAFGFGDVAVLCRASGSFSAYEAAFEKAGIPYLTIAGQGFYDRPEIRDILNALQVFADPQNDLAVVGLMRSPVVGFPDDMLLKFRDMQKENEQQSLFETVKQNTNLGAGEFHEITQQFVALVGKYRKLVGRISVAEIINQYFEETGYLAALAMQGSFRSIQNLKKLIKDAQISGFVSVLDFLNTITELKNVSVREGEAQTVAEGAVQIMSVHQSKGLEFPVVVIGDISKKNRLSRDILIDLRFGLIPPFNQTTIAGENTPEPEIIKASSLAYELALEEERKKEEAESNRLLYVAATRAQDLLIINGVLGRPTKNGTIGKLGGWLEKIGQILGIVELPADFQVKGTDIINKELDLAGNKVSLSIYESNVEFEFNKYFPEQINPEVSTAELPNLDLISITGTAKEIDWRRPEYQIRSAVTRTGKSSAPARIVGDVVHRALELWKFPHQGEAEFIDWAIAELKSRGLLSDKEIKNGFRRTKEILERFCNHELYQRMNSADILKHEIPYSIPEENNSFQAGTIDAMFKEADQWILVEFKTDEIRDQKRFEWVWNREDYQEQVARYLKASEKILGKRPAPILCFLNYENRIHLETDQWN